MDSKQRIIRLVKELKQRSGRTYKAVAVEMSLSPAVTMSEHIFQHKFRRFPHRQTTYEIAEVVSLVNAFRNSKNKLVCEPVEAILLCSWAGVGLSAIEDLRKLYPKAPFARAFDILINGNIPIETLDWFDDEMRLAILQRINQRSSRDSLLTHQDTAMSTSPLFSLSILPNPLPDSEAGLVPDFEYYATEYHIQKATADIKLGNIKLAEKALNALLTVKRQHSTSQLRDIYHQLGIVKIKRADHTTAERYLHHALTLTSDLEQRDMATIIANIGANSFYQGQYGAALRHFKYGLALATEIKNLQIMVYAQENVATIAMERNQYDRAEQIYRQAENMANQLADPQRLAYLSLNSGIISEIRQDVESARNFYLKGLSHAAQVGSTELYLQLSLQMEMLSVKSGSRTEKGGLEELYNIAEREAYLWIQTRILVIQSRQYIQRFEHNLATESLRQALVLAQRMSHAEFIALSLYGLALIEMADEAYTDHQQLLQSLGFQEAETIYHHIPSKALGKKWLNKAGQYFQKSIPNLSDKLKYEITKALQLRFNVEN